MVLLLVVVNVWAAYIIFMLPIPHVPSTHPYFSAHAAPCPHPKQAHDFEAYQDMLRAQAGLSGAPAAGERYEQISKFLQGAGGACYRGIRVVRAGEGGAIWRSPAGCGTCHRHSAAQHCTSWPGTSRFSWLACMRPARSPLPT